MGSSLINTSGASARNRSEGGDFFKKYRLVLKDGEAFDGVGPDWQDGQDFGGEVVFNTGMTGYVESLTDPSYADQILTFTFPLIGNYGVPKPEEWESKKIHAAGVVVNELCLDHSHSSAVDSLLGWLEAQGVPILTEVDTRALTLALREHGTMAGVITPKLSGKVDVPGLSVPQVWQKDVQEYGPVKGKKVVLVDCGAKENIVRSLVEHGLRVKRVPAGYDFSGEDYDGVVYGNGPGDPTDYPETIAVLAKVLKGKRPVFGICLGTQLMALAAGGSTYKLPYGHRGHNQPCQQLDDERCFITSQNHGYAVSDKTLPKDWRVTFRNLNDDSVEGIEHVSKPFFSVQFHPEAAPGPTDTEYLFKKFEEML